MLSWLKVKVPHYREGERGWEPKEGRPTGQGQPVRTSPAWVHPEPPAQQQQVGSIRDAHSGGAVEVTRKLFKK
jgi:hypothetical protein